MDKEQNDVDEVMKQEKQRGRRPIDFEGRRKRTQLLRDMKKLLETASEPEFLEPMRVVGMLEGFPRLVGGDEDLATTTDLSNSFIEGH
jgi:hypothetical protein